jgi:uncharacterized protein YgiB involved in biofilm formation
MRVKKTEWLKGNAEEYLCGQLDKTSSRAWENRRNECDRAVPRAVSRAKCANRRLTDLVEEEYGHTSAIAARKDFAANCSRSGGQLDKTSSRAWENRRNECDRAVPRAVSRAKCAGAFDQG